jgi:protein-S-isoprenylcysteine O-methyltransferase Ste14
MNAVVICLSFLIGLPTVFLSGAARSFTIEGDSPGSCLFVDFVRWGPFCFAQDSWMPDITIWGGRVLGLLLVLLGYLQVRQLLRAKIQQLGPPPADRDS